MSQGILYYANEKIISLIDTRAVLEKSVSSQTQEFIPKRKEILNLPIKGPCKLLKLFETTFSRNENYLMCSVETDDNQIDTVRLYFWSLDFSKVDL
jgi:hypothetical protein